MGDYTSEGALDRAKSSSTMKVHKDLLPALLRILIAVPAGALGAALVIWVVWGTVSEMWILPWGASQPSNNPEYFIAVKASLIEGAAAGGVVAFVLAYRKQNRSPERKDRRNRSFPLLWTVLIVLACAVLIAWLVIWALWGIVSGAWVWPPWGPYPSSPNPDFLVVLKVGLTVVAGAGGGVALVVAYRKQALAERQEGMARRQEARAEREEDATKLLRFVERFGTAASQLGNQAPAVRLAGVYAMSSLADEYADRRQQCIDVLCAYLRLPYSPDPNDPLLTQHLSEQTTTAEDGTGSREQRTYAVLPNDQHVRATVVSVISAHLQPDAPLTWSANDFDFTGAELHNASFDSAVFSGERTSFDSATFTGENAWFSGARFSGPVTTFYGSSFPSQNTTFIGATFSGEIASFDGARFSGEITSFEGARLSGEITSFESATFSGEIAAFDRATFSGEDTSFDRATFSARRTSFAGAKFSARNTSFTRAKFSAQNTSFTRATFSAQNTSFESATFSGEITAFDRATFSAQNTSFDDTVFSAQSTAFIKAMISSPHTHFFGATFSGRYTSFSGATFSGQRASFDGAMFSGRNAWFDKISTGERTVIGMDGIDVLGGASITRDGRVFRGWSEPSLPDEPSPEPATSSG